MDNMTSTMLSKFQELGVQDPNNPTQDETVMVLKKYLNKEIDKSTFDAFMNIPQVDEKTIIDGLKTLTISTKEISTKTLAIIDKVVDAFKENLKTANTPEERAQIRKDLLTAIDKARNESNMFKKLMFVFVMVICVVFGFAGKYLIDAFLGNSSALEDDEDEDIEA